MQIVLLVKVDFSVSLLCLGCVWCFVSLFLIVSNSTIDCLERHVFEMTYYVSSGTLNPTHPHFHTVA